MIIKQLRRCGW